MILPLHIKYRELRILPNQPKIWQHLATRTDLSKNIRDVCLMTPNDRRDQRLPLTLNEAQFVKNLGIPSDPQTEMIQALSRFESLTSFACLEFGQHCQFTEEVFGALTNCHKLSELILGKIGSTSHRLKPESSVSICFFCQTVGISLTY